MQVLVPCTSETDYELITREGAWGVGGGVESDLTPLLN